MSQCYKKAYWECIELFVLNGYYILLWFLKKWKIELLLKFRHKRSFWKSNEQCFRASAFYVLPNGSILKDNLWQGNVLLASWEFIHIKNMFISTVPQFRAAIFKTASLKYHFIFNQTNQAYIRMLNRARLNYFFLLML